LFTKMITRLNIYIYGSRIVVLNENNQFTNTSIEEQTNFLLINHWRRIK
jgi:hypothetical protein